MKNCQTQGAPLSLRVDEFKTDLSPKPLESILKCETDINTRSPSDRPYCSTMRKPNLEDDGFAEQDKVEYCHGLYLRMRKEFRDFQKRTTRAKKMWREEERKEVEANKQQLLNENSFLKSRVRLGDVSIEDRRPRKRAKTADPPSDLLRRADRARDSGRFGNDSLVPRTPEAYKRETLAQKFDNLGSRAIEDTVPNLRLGASSQRAENPRLLAYPITNNNIEKTLAPTPESSSAPGVRSRRRSQTAAENSHSQSHRGPRLAFNVDKRSHAPNWNSPFIALKCTCVDLPPYFSMHHGMLPSLTTWPWGKLEFLSHVEQVANCKGHDRKLVAACSKMVRDNNESASSHTMRTRSVSNTTSSSDAEIGIRFAENFLASSQSSKGKCADLGRLQSSIPANEFYGSDENSIPTPRETTAHPSPRSRTKKSRHREHRERKTNPSPPRDGQNAPERQTPDPSNQPITLNPNPPSIPPHPQNPPTPTPKPRKPNPPSRTAAQKKLLHPVLSPHVPPHLRKSDPELLLIGKIVNPQKRHAAAPEAFCWSGRLRKGFDRLLGMDGEEGGRAWTAGELRRVLKG